MEKSDAHGVLGISTLLFEARAAVQSKIEGLQSTDYADAESTVTPKLNDDADSEADGTARHSLARRGGSYPNWHVNYYVG